MSLSPLSSQSLKNMTSALFIIYRILYYTCILNFTRISRGEKKSFFLKLLGWCSGLHSSFFCKRRFGLGWSSCCFWRCLCLDGHILSLPRGLWIGHVWCLGGRTGIRWVRGLWASCVYWHVRHLRCIQQLVMLVKFCPQFDDDNNKNFSCNCYCNSPCQKTYLYRKNISIKRKYLMHKEKKKWLLYHIYLYLIMWTKLNYMLKYLILIDIIKGKYLINAKKKMIAYYIQPLHFDVDEIKLYLKNLILRSF